MKQYVKLKYDRDAYNYENLRKGSLSSKSLSSEYSRLRKEANRRVRELGRKYSQSETYKNYQKGFPSIRDIKQESGDIKHELANVTDFLLNKNSSIRQMNKYVKESIETFQSHGYDFINQENIFDVYDFMEHIRNRYNAEMFGSETLMELYEQRERLKINKKSFEADILYWREHLDEMREAPERTGRGTKKITSSELAKRLGLPQPERGFRKRKRR